MSPRERAVYIISVAAELAGVHPQTLRTYERKGLIKPQRTAGGTRRYSERDVERVRLIQELTRGEGVNLAGVLRILALQDELEAAEERLERTRADIARIKAEAADEMRDLRTRRGTDLVLYRRTEIEPHRRR